MANRRLANSIAKKLTDLDAKIDREFRKNWAGNDKTDRWEAQQVELIKKAQKSLNLISVGVADGSAIYWEVNRTTRLVTFEWLYGGGDGYIDDWGKVVSVPISQANRMIKSFRPEKPI